MDTLRLDVTKAVLVTMDIHAWSATCRLTRDDLPAGVTLPPEELATLGSKRLFDPVQLRVFDKLKTRATRAIDKVGIRFMPSAWFVDMKHWPELEFKLAEIRSLWDAALDEFCASYDDGCRAWLQQFPQWADILRNAMPDVGNVRRRYIFRHVAMQVQPANDDAVDAVNGLSDAATEDMLRTANEVWRIVFEDRTKRMTQRTLSPVKDLSNKLHAMTFACPSCGVIAGILDEMTSKLSGHDLNAADEATVIAVVNSLRTIEGAKTLLDKYDTEGSEAAVIAALVGTAMPEPAPAQTPVVEEPKSMDDMMSMLDLL